MLGLSPRATVQMLLSAELVRSRSSSEDIYELVWTLEWVAKDTLLVITGDLVDGKRGSQTVTDPHEMLLHILLFNLRIRARKRNSDLRFNIGNHDLHSIVLLNRFQDREMWRSFTCAGHVEFAPDGDGEPWDRRASMLLPFYLCSPYLIIRLGSVLFVHGGLLATKVVKNGRRADSIYDRTVEAQELIHASMQKDPLNGMRQAIKEYVDYMCSTASFVGMRSLSATRCAAPERRDCWRTGESCSLSWGTVSRTR